MTSYCKSDKNTSTRIRRLCRRKSIKLYSGKELQELLVSGKVTTLGTGGFGSCVRLTGDNLDYVIKTFLGTSALWYLEKEVKVLARLRDVEGMQQVVGVCLRKRALLTQYAGPTLFSRGYGVSFGMLRQVVLRVGASVDHLTNIGLQHVDIKEDNVCVWGTRVTLIDFGLATEIGKKAYSGPIFGGWWMAPEVRLGRPVTDTSDAFSIAYMCEDLESGCDTSLWPQEFMSCIRQSLRFNVYRRQGITDLVEDVKKVRCPVKKSCRKRKRDAKEGGTKKRKTHH